MKTERIKICMTPLEVFFFSFLEHELGTVTVSCFTQTKNLLWFSQMKYYICDYQFCYVLK